MYNIDNPILGYWRKQVDHMCAHLKAHAQNEAEFRALIGDPKIGKVGFIIFSLFISGKKRWYLCRNLVLIFVAQLLTSTVQEDGYELSVTLTFALRNNKDPLAGRKIAMSGDYLSQHTEQDSWHNRDLDGQWNKLLSLQCYIIW